MLILNGKKFARNVDEFTATLFQNDGTAVGFYKPLKRKIELFDMQRNLIGVISEQGVLATATPLPTGKVWYSYGTPRLIGNYASYGQEREETRAALETHCIGHAVKPIAA